LPSRPKLPLGTQTSQWPSSVELVADHILMT